MIQTNDSKKMWMMNEPKGTKAEGVGKEPKRKGIKKEVKNHGVSNQYIKSKQKTQWMRKNKGQKRVMNSGRE